MIERTLIIGEDNLIPVKTGFIMGYRIKDGVYIPEELKFTRSGSAVMLNSENIFQNVMENMPRIDFTTGTASLYIEPSLSSISGSDSETFGDFYVNRSTKTYLSQLSVRPSADLALFQQTAAGSYFGDTYTVTSGNSYCASCIVDLNKSVSKLIGVRIADGNIVSLNLESETELINQFTTCDIKVIDLGNNIKRVNFIFTADSSNTFYFMIPADDGGTGNSSNDIAASCFQVYQCDYLASYIENTGSSVTRNADSLIKEDLQTRELLSSSEGSIVLKTTIFQIDKFLISLSVGSSNSNDLSIQTFSDGRVGAVMVNPSTTSVSINDAINGSAKNKLMKIGITYKNSELKLFINDAKVSEYISSDLIALPYDTLRFSRANGSSHSAQLIEHFSLYKKCMTETEILTELGRV